MDLKAVKRTKFGSGVAALRKEGLVPAELYGHGIENLHLAVAAKDFRIAYKVAGENKVINLSLDGESRPVLIYEVAKDSLTDEFQSIDFYQVKMDEEISAKVPVKFLGEAPAVKNFGGVLVKALDEIAISALPANIPESIEIDLSKLTELNQSVYVRDLPVSDKYKFEIEGSNVIITVAAQREEEEIPVAAPSLEDVKVESEEKKAARDASKAASSEADTK